MEGYNYFFKENEEKKINFWTSYGKRIFDVVFSLILILVTFPILVVVLILVYLQDMKNPIYKQKRVGKYNKEFEMYKVRSMVIGAEENGAQWALKNDNRITKVGKIIRLTRIDELPQAINVLKGDMSLIGPRPEREVFYKKFEKDIPMFRDRLKVKPGITGYAQVNGGYDLNPEEKLKLDLAYIEKVSIKEDFKIVFKTIEVIVNGNGAR
ncbi:sugar transferase [Clostridium sp.]|uniref:sugar transferase n=1 Tax=Clostridium sp. TaxID=1506 RepID=UPI003F354947